ncbi:MAG: deoxyribose-phosphate aldolase [Coriobacteriia bacterium]|nr:deoxyribose-phosphate aldolase [Coriobacteriia bacterium]
MDQTLLKPTVGPAAGHAWIAANADHGFASLCVSPFLVDAAAELLAISGTAVCSVCGFPLGYSTSAAKADEARDLVRRGCIEVDMVMNFAALLDGDHALVERDVRAVVDAVRDAGEGRCLVKVILETGHLSDDLIARGSEIAVTAGADFVKTSTGFGPRGASAADVRIMRATVGPDIGIKAAGGIRDLATALVMLDAGADRLGTSAGLEILAEADAAGM